MKDPRKAITEALMRRRPNPLAGRLAASPLAAALAQGAQQGAGPQSGTLPNSLMGALGGGALPTGMLGGLFGGGLLGGGFSPDSVAQRMPGFVDQAKQMLQSGNTGIGGLLSLFIPGARFTEGKARPGGPTGPILGAHPRSGFETVTLGAPTGGQMGQRGMSGFAPSAPGAAMPAMTKRRGPRTKT